MPVAPGMFTVFLRHWNVGDGMPEAATVNAADAPEQRVSPVGWLVIDGALLIPSEAMLLVKESHGLVMTHV